MFIDPHSRALSRHVSFTSQVANPDPTPFHCCCCIDFRFVLHAAGRAGEEWPWWQVSTMVRLYYDMAVFAVALSYTFHGGTAQYESCTNGTIADIGNGRCDAALNVASCGYDGGDCCPCTCSDGPDHSCSDNNFDCVYPDCDAPAAMSEETTCEESRVGDGLCDRGNNYVGCSWDGGDVSRTRLELRLVLLTIQAIVGALSGCSKRFKM